MQVRCLIVDDNRLFLENATSLLEREGLDVVGVAADSAEAIRLVSELRPDVTLVDIDLGDEDGFELARQLSNGSAASTEVILDLHAFRAGSRGADLGEPGTRVHPEDAALGEDDPRAARTLGVRAEGAGPAAALAAGPPSNPRWGRTPFAMSFMRAASREASWFACVCVSIPPATAASRPFLT